MNDFAEPGTLAPTGLHLGGTKYMVIQGEAGAVIRGKKVRDLGFPTIALRIVTLLSIYEYHYLKQAGKCNQLSLTPLEMLKQISASSYL